MQGQAHPLLPQVWGEAETLASGPLASPEP